MSSFNRIDVITEMDQRYAGYTLAEQAKLIVDIDDCLLQLIDHFVFKHLSEILPREQVTEAKVDTKIFITRSGSFVFSGSRRRLEAPSSLYIVFTPNPVHYVWDPDDLSEAIVVRSFRSVAAVNTCRVCYHKSLDLDLGLLGRIVSEVVELGTDWAAARFRDLIRLKYDQVGGGLYGAMRTVFGTSPLFERFVFTILVADEEDYFLPNSALPTRFVDAIGFGEPDLFRNSVGRVAAYILEMLPGDVSPIRRAFLAGRPVNVDQRTLLADFPDRAFVSLTQRVWGRDVGCFLLGACDNMQLAVTYPTSEAAEIEPFFAAAQPRVETIFRADCEKIKSGLRDLRDLHFTINKQKSGTLVSAAAKRKFLFPTQLREIGQAFAKGLDFKPD